ncbi:DUF2271 domain-containing protein [Paraglaciecola sp.]|uniref:DUF2271 domain-containing protein n=1 Tax=Paraglaciecola sp. TaxID=1920173 RepID=UPI0030F3EFD3
MKNLLPTFVLLPTFLLLVPSFTSSATSLEVQVNIPAIDVAEYHAPYVAMWLQSPDKKITNLALWYDMDMRNDEGQQWLKDIRQWWRRSGRTLSLPADGISGATRKTGSYTLNFKQFKNELSALPAGDYEFFIEAVREVGGREIVSIPLTLPVVRAQTLSGSGDSELAQIILKLQP